VTSQKETTFLFLGLATVLIVASAIGWLLKRFVAKGAAHPAIDNLNARVKAWWAMIVVIGLAAWIGTTAVVVLFALLSFFALREFLTLTPTRRADHLALSFAFFFVLPLQYYLVAIEWYALFAIFIPVYVFLLLPILSALGSDTTRFLARTAETQWGLMIAVYCLSHVPALLALDIPGYQDRNLLLVFYLLLVVQASDVLQYVWGKLLGKRKVAPALSPSKTVEGLVGGGLSAVALGTALWWITPFPPLWAAGISLIVVAMGFFGGLVMSAIKRDRGVKDWGAMIEGHGGMLDRLDSVCFAAPVFFHVTRFFFTL
jgi:phosphatidate cytidylyltransferase